MKVCAGSNELLFLAASVAREHDNATRRAEIEQVAAAKGHKPAGRRPSKDRVGEAQARVAQARAAADQAEPRTTRVNVTDPDSRIMKTASGWVQGYNARAAVNESQIVVAAFVTQEVNDVHQLLPAIAATQANMILAGLDATIGRVLADAGYWSEENATAEGPDRLIATLKDWKQRQAARLLGQTTGPPPPNMSTIDAMEHRLRTVEGAAEYARRSCTVEPVFGDTKTNRGFRYFMRRGLDAASSEWSLICATGNLLKLFRHDHNMFKPVVAQ